MQKRLVLVCEGSLCPIKLPEVSGPGLEEAGRYRMVSELTLTVSRARGRGGALRYRGDGVSGEGVRRVRGPAERPLFGFGN